MYDSECKLGKEGAHAWMKDHSWRGRERGNKQALFMPSIHESALLNTKQMSQLSPNDGTSTWVVPDCLSAGRAFTICSCLLSGMKRQTHNQETPILVWFDAYCGSHYLRHVLKSQLPRPFLRLCGRPGLQMVRHSIAEQRTWFKSWIWM